MILLEWERDQRLAWFEGWRLGARGYHVGDAPGQEREEGHAAGVAFAERSARAENNPTPLWRFGWSEGAFYGTVRRFASKDAERGAAVGAAAHREVRRQLAID